ncbi:MAG: PQQ-binding-like beta-propeller repeat protein [Acidobacteria bacterium]|nr:PQQ-binding-like beta-propeller repeat protein [Acidobacteriota bacterium]
MKTRLAIVLPALVVAACSTSSRTSTNDQPPPPTAAIGPITDDLLRDGHRAHPEMWPTYGGDWAQTRYSPLTDIDRRTVTGLRPAWIAQTGIVGSFESTPVVLGRELYFTTPADQGRQRIVRLDSVTGEVAWQVELEAQGSEDAANEDLHLPRHFGPNRGVVAYGNRVYTGTLNGTLLALDRATGARHFEVKTASPRITGAPAAAKGRIIQGISFVDRGVVQAFDAETGALAWTWYAIPSPEEGGWWGDYVETIPGTDISLGRDIAWERANRARLAEGWKTGGASAPMTPTIDGDRGLAFVSTGGPDPTAFPPPSEPHPGDMRWTNSVCAIRIDDGRTAWCSQFLPHDIWGASGPTPPILITIEQDGKPVEAVAKFTGMGNLYVWNRDTGALLVRSDNYMPVPETTGGPAGSNLIRGGVAGTLWSPGAYSLETKLLYSVNQRVPGYFQPRDEARGSDQFGNIAAVDPVTGRIAWTVRTERPQVGGVLATAGGLVFTGRTSGSFDAYDAATGARLWAFRMGAGCNAAPATYRVDGRQYVVAACGGHANFERQGGDALVAFALP